MGTAIYAFVRIHREKIYISREMNYCLGSVAFMSAMCLFVGYFVVGSRRTKIFNREFMSQFDHEHS